MLLLMACGEAPVIDDSATVPTDDTGTTGTTDLDAGPGDFLYERGEILAFSLTLDQAALDSLAVAPDTDVHATFEFRDESWDVGLHLKGSEGSFRTMDEKAAFKLDFHEWDPDASFHGVRRMTLNNMVQDASMMAEHAAYWLFAARGVPSPRHGYAQVTVNGELFGLYGIVESMDEQFLARQWADDEDGALWEGGYGADILHGREDNFVLQESGGDTDLEELTALTEAFRDVTGDALLPVLESAFDIDTLLDMWAVELAIGDEDGYVTLGNNYLIYHTEVTPLWWMIPWGPDQSFVEDSDVHANYDGELAIQCLAAEDCKALLDEHVLSVADTMESEGLVGFIAEEAERISEACRTDPRSPWGDYGCRDALIAVENYAEARPGSIRGQLQ